MSASSSWLAVWQPVMLCAPLWRLDSWLPTEMSNNYRRRSSWAKRSLFVTLKIVSEGISGNRVLLDSPKCHVRIVVRLWMPCNVISRRIALGIASQLSIIVLVDPDVV